MPQAGSCSTARLNDLQLPIDWLSGIKPRPHPFISCYLDLGQRAGDLNRFSHARLKVCAGYLPAPQRSGLTAGSDILMHRLHSDLPRGARGLALFIATGRATPLLSAKSFADPFRNGLTVSSPPDLFPRLQLRELSGRFRIVDAEPGRLLGAMPAPEKNPRRSTAASCLRSMVEFEAARAGELTRRVIKEAGHHGPAVAGPEADQYSSTSGLYSLCRANTHPDPVTAVDPRAELIRLAGQKRIPVELVSDDAPRDYDSVACLLRKHPYRVSQRLPAGYRSLDLVA